MDINVFPGETFGAKVANAAKSLGADVLSPNFVADNSPVQDPALAGFIPFTTKEMVNQAHANGMKAKPWTVSLDGFFLGSKRAHTSFRSTD